MEQEHLARLAQFFLLEPDASALEHLRTDPRFAPAASVGVEDLRIEFTRLFAMSVFPYASVFRDPEGLMNTETTARVEAEYAQARFLIDPRYPIGAPDHFGAELLFASHLFDRGNSDAAQAFLLRQVLPWTGIFTHAVERAARQDFYRVLARETRQWLFENAGASPSNLPATNASLIADDDTGLDSVVMLLLTPARSGIYLNKDDLRRIANQVDVPISFGDRWLMLRSLFQAAGEYGKIGELVRLLITETDSWMGCFSDDARTYSAHPDISQEWLSRVEKTRTRLGQMERDHHENAQAR